MVKEISRLQSQIAALTQPKLRIKGTSIVQFIKQVHTIYDISGKPYSYVVVQKKERGKLTPSEDDAYNKQVCTRSMNGQAAKISRIVTNSDTDDESVRFIAQQIADLAEELNSKVNLPGAKKIREQDGALVPVVIRRRGNDRVEVLRSASQVTRAKAFCNSA